MSIWIRALCTRPLGDLTPADLRAGIAERLPTIAPLYGEEDAEAIAASVTIAGEPPLGVWELSYRDNGSFIRVERWSAKADVREEVGELLDTLAECDEEGVEDVRALLADVVESVGFELKVSDCEGAGWPVAVAAAAALAARGEGLVQADGEGWMEPSGRGVEHVLDGD